MSERVNERTSVQVMGAMVDEMMAVMSKVDMTELAIRTHMRQPPHSVICDHRAHVHKMEGGSGPTLPIGLWCVS